MNPPHLLPVMEHFYTLQGEGHFAGRAAYFIRLGGCDVGCTWCDVKESWDANVHPTMTNTQLMSVATQYPSRIVVITGGEPLMYNLDVLTQTFRDGGYRTHLETSGAHPLSGSWDWVCFSPKKFKEPLPEVVENADELKIIVYNKHDFQWAEMYANKVSPKCLLYLQPEWSKAETMLPLIIDYIKESPKWAVSLQTHKYMNIP
jgi:7-carboxy-7-deazaguanine synthase